MNVQAATTWCQWDSNFPSSIPKSSPSWQGPAYFRRAYWANDARNSWNDSVCDFRMGIPQYSLAVYGSSVAGWNAISCYGSLIARSDKSGILTGSMCSITKGGIWDANTLKNNLYFRRNY